MSTDQKQSPSETRDEHRSNHKRKRPATAKPSQSPKSSNQPRRLDYSTHISDIHGATTIKYNQVFMLTNTTGDILPANHGYGMYFRDMCYLDRMELRLQGQLGVPLLSDASSGAQAVFELTNPHLQLADAETLAKERLSIRRVYSLQPDVTQEIVIRNLSQDDAEFELAIHFGSQFADMFVVRGRKPGKRGELRQPDVKRGKVILTYEGANHHLRTTTLRFSPEPDELDGSHAAYHLRIRAREHADISLSFELLDEGPSADESAGKHSHQTGAGAGKHASFADELADVPSLVTTNPLFDRALQRSLADIKMLATVTRDDLFVAAGVPWYVALFGRDSCITAFETLAFHPALARSTLLLLAQYQGTKDDPFQDEEPGKILHELRVGEMAHLREVPMIPYYGTVDATPWFLMLLAEYVRWTGDLALFRHLRENVDRALTWLDENERDPRNIPGFISYGSRSEKGLLNQGWKDSDNGIVNTDGTICRPPIALVEVQGYAYRARAAVAELFRATGDEQRAERLERQADDLKRRFNESFWLDDEKFYAFCLQRDRQPSTAIASNPGHTLFTSVVADDRAADVAARLMRDDMFCGWGVRTLSADEKAYNPLDYQTGSVWPHDNALIALGMRRWGLSQPMERIFTGIFQAATQFPDFRMPEVFDGFSQQQYPRPVHYPVACQPQAWAAGALPLLLQTALGLEPEALKSVLRIHQPHLPGWLPSVTLRGLRVGGASVDLEYRREGDTTLVAVLSRSGTLDILVQY